MCNNTNIVEECLSVYYLCVEECLSVYYWCVLSVYYLCDDESVYVYYWCVEVCLSVYYWCVEECLSVYYWCVEECLSVYCWCVDRRRLVCSNQRMRNRTAYLTLSGPSGCRNSAVRAASAAVVWCSTKAICQRLGPVLSIRSFNCQ